LFVFIISDNPQFPRPAHLRPASGSTRALAIDTDAVPAIAVVFQRFQAVAIRNTQIIQTSRLMQHQQFPSRHALNLHRQPPGRFVVEQLFSFTAGKAADHARRL
jgi:hypothetical protein